MVGFGLVFRGVSWRIVKIIKSAPPNGFACNAAGAAAIASTSGIHANVSEQQQKNLVLSTPGGHSVLLYGYYIYIYVDIYAEMLVLQLHSCP